MSLPCVLSSVRVPSVGLRVCAIQHQDASFNSTGIGVGLLVGGGVVTHSDIERRRPPFPGARCGEALEGGLEMGDLRADGPRVPGLEHRRHPGHPALPTRPSDGRGGGLTTPVGVLGLREKGPQTILRTRYRYCPGYGWWGGSVLASSRASELACAHPAKTGAEIEGLAFSSPLAA